MAGSETDANNPLFTQQDRLNAILSNTAGTILFNENEVYSGQTSNAYGWWQNEVLGANVVNSNKELLDTYATEFGIDVNLFKAIVFLENAHGYYDTIDPFNHSVRPGNVNPDIWASLLNMSIDDVRNNAANNLRLSAKIISEISARLENPTNEAIATLYNQLSADVINGYGLTVERYFEDRPWELFEADPTLNMNSKDPNWLQSLVNLFNPPPIDPLVIDLDNDSIELTLLGGSHTYFDLDGDGFRELTGWVAPDDGLLAVDLDGNGKIDGISELFGSATASGFADRKSVV